MTDVRFPDGYSIERLGKTHPRSSFRSSQDAVNRFLRERALQSQDKRLSATQLLIETASGRIAGYYTLAIGQVGFDALPESITRKLPRRELPVAILAWLGVDKELEGRGLGTRLLARALFDCWHTSQTFPFVALVLDAIDDESKGFYLRWDFREIPGHPLRLFLSAAQLNAMMRPRSS